MNFSKRKRGPGHKSKGRQLTYTCPNCKEEKNIDEFYFRKNSDRVTSYCKICNRLVANDRARKLKILSVKYLGGKCSICGYNKCLAAMEFHHKDMSIKEFSISKSKSKVFSNIKNELDKCIILCSNCHREIHASLAQLV